MSGQPLFIGEKLTTAVELGTTDFVHKRTKQMHTGIQHYMTTM